MQSYKVVVGWAVVVTGAVLTIVGYTFQAYGLSQAGLTAVQWQGIGAALFFGSIVFLLIQYHKEQVRLRADFEKTKSQPSTPVGEDLKSPEEPASSPTPQSQPNAEEVSTDDDRIFLNMTPEDICGIYRGTTDFQAEKIFGSYKGKWIRAEYLIENIHSPFHRHITLDAQIPENPHAITGLRLKFADKWTSRLEHLSVGNRIKVVGRLERASKATLDLVDCELAAVKGKGG